jgi:hypothetical protein
MRRCFTPLELAPVSAAGCVLLRFVAYSHSCSCSALCSLLSALCSLLSALCSLSITLAHTHLCLPVTAVTGIRRSGQGSGSTARIQLLWQ